MKRILSVFMICFILVSIMSNTIISNTPSIAATTLDTPVISNPDDGDELGKADVTVKWGSVSGANYYRISVKDITRGEVLVDNYRTTGTSYKISSGKLTKGHEIKVAVGAYSNDGGESYWDEVTFNIEAQEILETPEISDPDEGDEIEKKDITVRWDSVRGANYYRISVKDMTSGDMLAENYKTTGTTYKIPTGKLTHGHEIKVAVGAYSNDGGESYWDEIIFYIETLDELKPPVISSPSNGDELEKGNVTIKWDLVAGANYYRLSVKDLTSDTMIADNYSSSSTSYTINSSKLIYGHEIKIAVGAYANDGRESKWNDLTFKVKDQAPLATPQISQPSGGDILKKADVTIQWDKVSEANYYLISILDVTTGTYIAQNSKTTGTSALITSGKLAYGHEIKVAVGAYANDGRASGWDEVTFKIEEQAQLITPGISQPAEGAVLKKADVTVQWDKVSEANYYLISVLDVTSGTYLAQNAKITSTNYKILSSKLVNGHEVKVAVGAYANDGRASGWKEVTFKIEEIGVLSTPEISQPADGNVFPKSDITIQWDKISEANYYLISIVDLTSGVYLVQNVKTTSTNYKILSSKLVYGHEIKVAVGAYANDGRASGWDDVTFKVTSAPTQSTTPTPVATPTPTPTPTASATPTPTPSAVPAPAISSFSLNKSSFVLGEPISFIGAINGNGGLIDTVTINIKGPDSKSFTKQYTSITLNPAKASYDLSAIPSLKTGTLWITNTGTYWFEVWAKNAGGTGIKLCEKDFTVSTDTLKLKIAGIVKNKYTQNPISGVTVRLNKNDFLGTTTDSNGYFEFNGVAANTTHLLIAEKEYFVLADENNEQIPGMNIDVLNTSPELLTVYMIDASGKYEIYGKVTDSVTKKGVPGAKITPNNTPELSVASSVDGSYRIIGVGNGHHSLVIEKEGYLTGTQDVAVADKHVLLDLTISMAQSLDGFIYERNYLDGKNLGKVSGALVWLNIFIEKFSAVTDVNGQYFIDGIAPSTHALRAIKEGYQTLLAQPIKLDNYSGKKSFDIVMVQEKNIPSDWAKENVKSAYQNGLLTEKTKIDFRAVITRMEFCELAVNLYEKISKTTIDISNVQGFSDVTNPEDIITTKKARAIKITSGTGENKFSPKFPIVRQDFCRMLYSMLKRLYPGITADINKLMFKDNDSISVDAKEAVAFMVENEIIVGIGDGSFVPLNYASKEQAIKIINVINNKSDELKSKSTINNVSVSWSPYRIGSEPYRVIIKSDSISQSSETVTIEMSIRELNLKSTKEMILNSGEYGVVELPYNKEIWANLEVQVSILNINGNAVLSESCDVTFLTQKMYDDMISDATDYLNKKGVRISGEITKIDNPAKGKILFNGQEITLNALINSFALAVDETADFYVETLKGSEKLLSELTQYEINEFVKAGNEIATSKIPNKREAINQIVYSKGKVRSIRKVFDRNSSINNEMTKSFKFWDDMTKILVFINLTQSTYEAYEFFINESKDINDYCSAFVIGFQAVEGLVSGGQIITSKYFPKFYESLPTFLTGKASAVLSFASGAAALAATLIVDERRDLHDANETLGNSIDQTLSYIHWSEFKLYSLGAADKFDGKSYGFNASNNLVVNLYAYRDDLSELVDEYEFNIEAKHFYGLGVLFWGNDRLQGERELIKAWRLMIGNIDAQTYYKAGYEGNEEMLTSLWD